MHRKLRLIPCSSPEDVNKLLLRLVDQAAIGEVSGLLSIVIYKGQVYEAHIAGEAITNPTFSRGALLALDDYLSTIVHENGPV